MRWWIPVALLASVALVGCLGGDDTDEGEIEPTGTDSAQEKLPRTLDEILNATKHVRVLGKATLVWEFPNATEQSPQAATDLVYIGNKVTTVGLSKDDDPLLAAFLPVKKWAAMNGCEALPGTIHSYFRPADGSQNDDFGTLGEDYAPGWYHAIVAADGPSSIQITFDDTEAVRPRTHMPDPFVTVEIQRVEGGRQASFDGGSPDGPWAVWAVHTMTDDGTDAGRTHELRITPDCATATDEGGNLFFGGQDRTVAAAALGNQTAYTIEADYQPTQGATAPQESALAVVTVVGRPIVYEPPPEPEPDPDTANA